MPASNSHTDLATMCGRHLRISHLPLDHLPGGGRVTLSVRCSRFDAGEVWISLTGPEARRLAEALMREATTLHAPGQGVATAGAAPAPPRPATAPPRPATAPPRPATAPPRPATAPANVGLTR